ncbi:hypothetical protein FKM82_011827 [Ascaphus truei]
MGNVLDFSNSLWIVALARFNCILIDFSFSCLLHFILSACHVPIHPSWFVHLTLNLVTFLVRTLTQLSFRIFGLPQVWWVKKSDKPSTI